MLLLVLCGVAVAANAETPTRIVSLAPNLTAMVEELGAAGSLIAVTPFCDAPENIRRVPGGMQPEAEALLALQPELVLATSITPAATLRQLRALGIRTEVIQASSLSQISHAMDHLAGILKVPPRRVAISAAVPAQRSAALLFGAETGYSAGCGTHAHEILISAGLRNVAADAAGPWPQLGEEFLLAADPDVIIVADYGAAKRDDVLALMRGHPVRKHLAAVRAGRVVVFPAAAFSIPGPAALDAGEKLRVEVEKL
jgi:ABC-type Fe3+-hydroxamate transport system substrate-binding protein